jgi:5,10-methylenetetrahydromethanopterin reductase
MSIGLITHIDNPSLTDVRRLGEQAEEAGADWLGVPDAFWWRDTWVLGAEVATATKRLAVGPVVTNPYMRHPYVTVAAIATLQELAGNRVLVGIGAGGSEIAGAARLSRLDAPARIEELVGLIRQVAAGGSLDEPSGRTLEVPLALPRIIVAGRGDQVLRTAGRVADEALLWAVPQSELDRTVGLVAAGALGRPTALPAVELTWAPLVEHDDASAVLIRRAATYAVLNNRAAVRERWGVSPELVARVRKLLVAGDTATAEKEIPDAVIEDLATDADPVAAGAIAARIGATSIALPATDTATVADRVAWAERVLAAASVTADSVGAEPG